MDTTRDSNGTSADAAQRATHAHLRDDVVSIDAKVDEAPKSTHRPRPRDPATFNDYRRRPPRTSDEQTPTKDSTAFPAGTPAVPFKRTPSAEQHHGDALHPAGKEENAPRRIEALEADWTPKRPRKESRYESLPPSVAHLPATPKNLTEDGDQSDADTATFSTLRAALLAEARRSARGRKR